MTYYCWERGTIRLPRSATATVRRVVRDAGNAHHDAVLRSVRDLYREIAAVTTDVERFAEILDGHDRRGLPFDYGVAEAADAVLSEMVFRARRSSGRAHRPTVSDVDAVAPRYAAPTAVFQADECTVTFSGNDVTWSVPENNHADERAHQTWLGHALLGALRAVDWTRGSGGVIMGNDEYNRDSSGADYVLDRFGPLGEATASKFVA